MHRYCLLFAIATTALPLAAQDFTLRVVARGLDHPRGITVSGNDILYATLVPNPGIPNAGNGVIAVDPSTGAVRVVHMGEPDPTNIAIDGRGDLYWTCRTAGVIVTQNATASATTAKVVARGLQRPSGISLRDGVIFFTQIPNPGIPQAGNGIFSLSKGIVQTLHQGEPEPSDIVASRDGSLYWTCTTAGVILVSDKAGIRPVLTGLDHPVGITIDRDVLYWTEVPTPGVSGVAGGRNKVWRFDERTKVKELVHSGDPQPTDITVDRHGSLYWTCTSAGVIVEAEPVPSGNG